MKKHLFLWAMMFMVAFKSFAQPSVAATTPPTRNASNVVSLFSDAYTNVSGVNFFPNWGQSTVVSDVTVAGNNTKLYAGLTYQGMEFSSALNVSTMEKLHMDIWTADASTLNVFLINTSPATVQQEVVVNPTLDGWYSIDIPLSSYTNINLSNIGQMMFTGSGTLYIDNMYFWRSGTAPTLGSFTVPAKVLGDAAFNLTAPTSNSPGAFTFTSSNTNVATISGSTVTLAGLGSTTITATQAASGSFGAAFTTATLVVSSPPPATAAPTPPTRSASNVVSMFSNAYSNVTVDTWSTGWDNTGEPEDVLIAGNTTKLYRNMAFAGVEFISSPINASNMERFHIDIWTPDANVFKVKFVDLGADGAFGGGDDVEQELGYVPAKSTWVSYDIALSDFTGLITRGHIGQMIFVAEGGTIYMDNVYFWRTNPPPTFGSFTVAAKTITSAAFNLTAPTSNSTGAFTYTSSNTNVATISGSTVTIVGAGTSIISANQAAAGSFGTGSVTANLVVTGPAAPTGAAPTPPTRVASDVISLFSDSYSNLAGTDWFPWWWQNALAQDTTIAGNLTHKYPNLNYHGVQLANNLDVSGMSKFHFDIWTANCEVFDLYFINTTTGTERKVSFTPPFAGWRSYDVALSEFASQGIDLSNIGQLKLVSTPFGGTTVYIDNMYFWKPAGGPSYGTFSIPSKTVGDAKFKITAPTSTSPVAFTYTSSNTSVATISNDSIVVIGAGTTTITANQAAGSGFLAGSKSTIFNVDFAPPVTAAPVPPTRNAADVISLFSNSYTNVNVDTWSTSWDAANVSDIQLQGNATKKYTSHLFSGIDFGSTPHNATAMTTFHLDVWTPDANVFRVKLVDFGADGAYAGGNDSDFELTFTPTKGGWNSFDIPLANFTGLASRAHLAQLIFSTAEEGNPLRTLYLDNVYFYKGTALSPSINITQPTCAVATGTVSIVSPVTGFQYSKDNGVTFGTATTFSSLPTGTYKIRSKSPNNVVSDSVVAVILSTTPAAPGTITGNINVSQCDTLQTYSVVNTDGYTYKWTVTGTGNSVKSGQGLSSAVLIMKTSGTVSCSALKCGTTYGQSSSKAVSAAQPAAPTVFTSTSTNVCSYTASAVAVTGVKDTFRLKSVAGATGYYFTVPAGSTMQRLNDTTITVVFADTITLSATSPRTVNGYALSSCDTSLAKSITLTRTAAATPGVIYNSFTAGATTGPAAVTAVCSIVGGAGTTYKIRKVASALTYTWSVKSGANMIVTHENTAGGINDTAITVQYLSGFASDSIFVQAVNGCGASAKKAIAVLATKPAAPASITGVLVSNVCGARVYRYSAPALVAATATAGAATGYLWTLPNGAVGSTGVLDSGNVNSQVIRVRYSSNAAAVAGDSIRVAYASTCGYSANKALKLANTLLGAPAAPASITATLVSDVCGARVYRYSAPDLSIGSTTIGAAQGYTWSLPTGSAVALSATLDSGSLSGANARYIRLKYTNNGAAPAGDSVRVRFTSACGVGANKALKLTNLAKVCLVDGTPIYSKVTGNTNEIKAEIFPNPNNGNFRLNVKTGIAAQATATIQIIDMYGKVVNQFTAQNANGSIMMNVSDSRLVNGLYTVRFAVGSVTNSIKLMINK